MDSIITGVVGLVMFLLFTGGLAVSIGALPFTIIVIFIGGLTAYGLYEDIRSDRKSSSD